MSDGTSRVEKKMNAPLRSHASVNLETAERALVSRACSATHIARVVCVYLAVGLGLRRGALLRAHATELYCAHPGLRPRVFRRATEKHAYS